MGEKCHRKKGGYGRDTFATCETKKREGGEERKVAHVTNRRHPCESGRAEE